MLIDKLAPVINAHQPFEVFMMYCITLKFGKTPWQLVQLILSKPKIHTI